MRRRAPTNAHFCLAVDDRRWRTAPDERGVETRDRDEIVGPARCSCAATRSGTSSS
jgi:hypothetical protein